MSEIMQWIVAGAAVVAAVVFLIRRIFMPKQSGRCTGCDACDAAGICEDRPAADTR